MWCKYCRTVFNLIFHHDRSSSVDVTFQSLNRDIKLFRLYVAKVPTNDNKYLNQIVEAISKNTCRNIHHKRKIKSVSVTTNIIYCNHTGYYQQKNFVGPENKYIIFMIFP
jgi:hypothetical protein